MISTTTNEKEQMLPQRRSNLNAGFKSLGLAYFRFKKKIKKN
jgi:hypothetical protein